jgi:hypothetical protein
MGRLMPTRHERFTLYAILIACVGVYFAIRIGIVQAWLAITAPAMPEPILQFTPELPVTAWGVFAAAFLLVSSLLAYWLGPIIIARGIERAACEVQEFDGN